LLEPRLLLTGGQEAAIAFPAMADVSVRQDQLGRGNFYVGNQPEEEAFIRFDVSSYRGKVSEAKVRLVPAVASGSVERHAAYAVGDDAWSENGMTWTARPARADSPLASWMPQANMPVEFDVTPLVRRSLDAGDSLISISLVSGATQDRVRYHSREHVEKELRPQLIVAGDFINARPEAARDTHIALNDGTPLSVVSSEGLLANDSDTDNDPLTVGEIVEAPRHGTLSWQPDGSFIYTVNDLGYVGQDTFRYVASDAMSQSRPATVTIDVQQAMTLRIPLASRVSLQDLAGEQKEEFVRFDLSGLARQVFGAKVRLFSGDAETVHAVSDDNWSPAGMRWDNRPHRDDAPIARRVRGEHGVIEFDISSLVRDSLKAGDKQISLAFLGPSGARPDPMGAEGEGGGGLELILTTSNVITVDSVLDNDDASQNGYTHTTLREAIQLANDTSESEVIAFDLGEPHPVITLEAQRGEIPVSSDMYILGPSDGTTLTITVEAGADMRVFNVASGTLVGISDLMIEGVSLTTGDGGAVYNAGDLTLERVTVSGNSSSGSGGGLYNAVGAQLTLNNATLSGNSAGGDGGGVYNAGTLTINNGTISNNSAVGAGSGIRSAGTSTLKNTLVAGNDNDDDVDGAFVSGGYNLIGNADGATGFGSTGDQTGTTGAVIDPLLGPLQDNGGSAPTHQLLAGSPAIDAGDNSGVPETDARGAPRILDGLDPGHPDDAVATADIGAFEFGALFVNTGQDMTDLTPLGDGRADTDASTEGDQISLRSAVQELNALAGSDSGTRKALEAWILFTADTSVQSLRLKGAGEDLAASGDLDVFGNLTIWGSGFGTTMLDAGYDLDDPGCVALAINLAA